MDFVEGAGIRDTMLVIISISLAKLIITIILLLLMNHKKEIKERREREGELKR